MVSKFEYGKRGRNGGMEAGTRNVSSTFGKTLNPVSARKFTYGGNDVPFLVDREGEQLVTQILDIEPEVIQFRPQGVTVDLIEGALLSTPDQLKIARHKYRDIVGPCLYTVDFFVDFTGARQRALEVKLDTFQGDNDYREKLRLARMVLSRFGCELSTVIVPEEKRHSIWWNVPLVAQALRRKDLWPSPETLAKIDVVAQSGATTGAEFAAGLGLNINMLPILIASGALQTDLLGPHLNGSSTVEPAHGTLDHLSLLESLEA